jgi:hypothetical protein
MVNNCSEAFKIRFQMKYMKELESAVEIKCPYPESCTGTDYEHCSLKSIYICLLDPKNQEVIQHIDNSEFYLDRF